MRRRPPRATSRLTAAVVLVAIVGACGGDDAEPAADRTSKATPAPAADYRLRTSGVPRIEDADCPTRVPTLRLVRCLSLVVPESRGPSAAGDRRLVRLPVVIVAAREPSKRHDDPVLWMNYSAGDGFVAGRVHNFIDQPVAINKHRDVVTLDLRGTGGSEPSLACPEVTALNAGPFVAEIDETSPEGRKMRLNAIKGCRDRLAGTGVDLSAYGSDNAAMDLEDLRLALGVKRWNLVVGEYGSKLAQLLVRDHASSVRSVVVNSTPVPLQADWFGDLAANAAQAWSALVAGCQADAGCSQAFPRLGGRLDAIVADLAAHPRHFDEVRLDNSGRGPFLLTASRMLAYVRLYGRDSNFAFQLPMSLAGPPGGSAGTLQTFEPDKPATLRYQASDAYIGDTWGLWELIPQNASTDDGAFALGAHLSAVCRDEAPFTSDQRLAEAAAVPLFGPFLGRHADLEACGVWGVEPGPPAANEAVRSDVPILVLAGEYDTVSSPAWADAFDDTLTAARVLHFAGTGTQPSSGHPTTAQACALALRDVFLAEPTAPVDDGCVATSRGPAFSLP